MTLVNTPAIPRPSRLGIAVLETLTDNIVSGELPPGSTLPTNPDLCIAFGVSRTVVRESLKLMEEKGLIRAKQGQGTTVEPRNQWNLLDPLVLQSAIRYDENLEILDNLIDVRVSLECLMVKKAALAMTEDQLTELRASLSVLESLRDDPDRYLVADTEYHDVILVSSGNQLGRSVIRSIHPFARASTRYNPKVEVAEIQISHKGHVEIFERIVARDEEGASRAMYQHIMGSWIERKNARLGNK
jgi:DNA-binding FadR family transcriptional regulator